MVSVLAAHGCGGNPPPTAVSTLGSRVELAAGDVWLVTKTGQRRLVTGAMLPRQARLSVGRGARALVRLGNGTGAFLRHGTQVSIDGESIDLQSGELWADIRADEHALGRFSAGAVTATASGAGLDLAIDGEAVKVYVARGLAVITAPGGRTEVETGERATVASAAAPPVVEPVAFWEDWTGGMADRGLNAGMGGRGSGRIYGVNRTRPGAPPVDLQIRTQAVSVTIRDGIAHTTVDQRFFNPSSVDLEGWYWFTVPEGASVARFAVEANGQLVEGAMVERKQAAAAYQQAIQRSFDPALLEWIDGRTFRARIYPIPAVGERRIVLAYTQLLPLADGVYRYVYPMAGEGRTRIQEFSLQVELGEAGEDFEIGTLQDARIGEDASTVSMRRSGFVPRSDFLLELRPKTLPEPMRAMRFSTGSGEADFVFLRYAPEVSWGSLKEVPGDVVVVVDTSAGGGETERQVRADVTEAILRAFSDGDRFAVVAADLTPRVVYPAEGLAQATESDISIATEKLSEIGSAGATDLGEMFNVALERIHDAEQPAVVYVGDGRPTVGEVSALALAERLRRSLGDSRARLFTIAVGADANHPLLERIARVGGGRAFRIDSSDQTVQQALRFAGLVKTPTVTDLVVDAGAGLDQRFSTAASKVTEGEEVLILARTHHDLPESLHVSGRLAGKPFKKTYPTVVTQGPEYGYIPMLWARQYLDRLMGDGLEESRGTIISLGLDHTLMTPFTSFLVLESEQAYEDQGINRRQPRRPSPSSPPVNDRERTVTAMKAAESEDLSVDFSPVDSVAETTARPAPVMPAAPAPPPSDSAPAPRSRRPAQAALGGAAGPTAGSSAIAPRRAPDTRAPVKIASGPIKPARAKKGVCSDASRRPLSQRRVLWQRRLWHAQDAQQYAQMYFEARQRCELPRWRHRRALLELIEQRVRTPQQVRALLDAFAGHRASQKFLRRRILKRALDPELTMGLYFPSAVDWPSVELGLAALDTATQRLARLRGILEKHPADPYGRRLLLTALLDADQTADARAVASRQRRDGLAGPDVLRILCELQAEANQTQEARRTCSELVEFNPADSAVRQQLGDLFLRHGWYDAAYRQYRTLVAMRGDNPASLLRLAAAAAGMGKVDEALRIERKVASGDGEPGPGDPRRWARLHSAVRLARVILETTQKGNDKDIAALERSLKRTGVMTQPATIAVLVWEDLEAPLDLIATRNQRPFPVSDRVASPETGLVMIGLGHPAPGGVGLSVKSSGPPLRRAVGFTLVTLGWDGRKFTLDAKPGELARRKQVIAL